ncbi:MAG: NGG1p interacting factor NIF3 [Gammaproteobacteria bacterium]|nr:NGG1p interacting factor NIF3 [Gammaproteobacteria bacterium]
MYLIILNVPESHLEIVKTALFEAGAGKVENYSHCSWECRGEGQFMPLSGSNPYIGTTNQLEKVSEYRVETICDESKIGDVITALKRAHPYEVPSYQVLKMENY